MAEDTISPRPSVEQPLLEPFPHRDPDIHQGGSSYDEEPSPPRFMVGAAMLSFFILGLFQASIGVILPHVQADYDLNDAQVSLIFVAGPVGYVIAAQLNHLVHVNLGQRGIAIIGPIFELISAVITASHPSFVGLLLSFSINCFGIGLIDGSWCAWAGAMKNPNLISGLLHGSFSAGAGLGPIIVSQLVATGGKPWYFWYYTGITLVEIVILPYAFRKESGHKYREEAHRQNRDAATAKSSHIFLYSAVWICAAYLLVDVGTETAISGWIVSFMLRVRHASVQLSGICSSCFWGGMAVGRLALGGVTDRLGVKRGTILYLLSTILLQLMFILVENQALSAVLITLIGFFIGPLFPSSIVQLSNMLPRDLVVAAVSYVASVGQVGGAFLPFAIGALSQWLGLRVFGVMIAIQLAVCLGLWMILTRTRSKTTTQERERAD
ncbi:hypothetical protein S7711_02740 [Stachybotrys chartarum IBT 7711]|uniref:Major facilitator superfamily (MFS) profile domain-containing protein n=1 Tax=Stachybotrys chartarum (strain CBS 109288 / IBT 7711) TaxID=1280523 RepID=A0A084ALU6_STACB|nr:hypothetical protein S7711_02740 [Stachybotrys chartarum IBT 7711]